MQPVLAHRGADLGYEKLKVLSVTGGVPRYLELIDTGSSAEDNFRRLLFSRNSVLLNEINFIFSDTFGARSEIYRKIVAGLVKGSASLNEILAAAARTKTGDYSDYLNDMVTAGFLQDGAEAFCHRGGEERVKRLKLPRNFSVRPVLLHVNGVHRDVVDSRFFAQVIDFGELLAS